MGPRRAGDFSFFGSRDQHCVLRGQQLVDNSKLSEWRRHAEKCEKMGGGARRDRTDDLYNAIVALSQLSYGPLNPLIPPISWLETT